MDKFEKMLVCEMIATLLGIVDDPNHTLIVIYTRNDKEVALLSRSPNPEIALQVVEQSLEQFKVQVLNRN